MIKTIKIILKVLLALIIAAVLVIAGYLGCVYFSYSRIADNLQLTPTNSAKDGQAAAGETYTIVTQNIGFGAYTQDFTFFMDGGTESRAKSKESVVECVQNASKAVQLLKPDFAFFQEVDTDADRSFHVDQRKIIDGYFDDYASVFAENYHSAYLFYPILKPHGASNSGIYTFSRFNMQSAVRRSLPVASGLEKFLDLDRCYSVTRIPVDNGKQLVLYNVHTSAYGADEKVRAAQLNMLFSDMEAEYKKGNYCVCGGDFNHDFTGDSTFVFNKAENVSYGWAQPFPEDILAGYDGISRALNYKGAPVATCRNCDVPYDENTFTLIVDGFLVSDNVEVVSVVNVDTEFVYSDHNPVAMQFILK